MSTELMVVRSMGSLRGADPASDEALRALPAGVIMRATMTTPRKRAVAWHNKFFALLEVIFPHQELYPTRERLRKAVLVALGFCTTFKLTDGREVIEADSMSIPKMEDAEFDALMERFFELVETKILPGIDRADVEREWSEVMSGYQNSLASIETHQRDKFAGPSKTTRGSRADGGALAGAGAASDAGASPVPTAVGGGR